MGGGTIGPKRRFRPPFTGACIRGEYLMPKTDDDTLGRIEATQAALRDSIEKAKALASQSERLIRQHRKEMDSGESPEPTDSDRLASA